MKGWFNLMKSNNIIYYINKETHHIIISKAEKASDNKCEQPLGIKTQCKMKLPYGVLITSILQKTKLCTYGKTIEVSSLKSGTRKPCSVPAVI